MDRYENYRARRLAVERRASRQAAFAARYERERAAGPMRKRQSPFMAFVTGWLLLATTVVVIGKAVHGDPIALAIIGGVVGLPVLFLAPLALADYFRRRNRSHQGLCTV